jgi:hypothetical protein
MTAVAWTEKAEQDRTDPTTLAMFRVVQCLMVVANLGRIPVISTDNRQAPITVNELALLALVVVGMIAVLRRRELHLDRIAVTALLFAFIGAASAVWNAQVYGIGGVALVVSLAYLARWLAYFMLYVVLRNTIGRADATKLWTPMEWMLIVLAGFGILQAAFLPNFAQMIYPDPEGTGDWDVQGRRLVSTILEPNIAGAMLMIGLLVQFAKISTGATVKRWKVALLLVALVLTVSRSAAVGLAGGVMTLLWIRGLSRRLIRVLIAIGAVGLLALPLLLQLAIAFNKFSFDAQSSGGLRLVAWLRALSILGDHLAFGIGFNTYGFVSAAYGYEGTGASSYATDGGLLFIAVMTGLVGLLIYCAMLAMVIIASRRVWADPGQTPEARGLAIGVASSTVAVVIHSVFANSILTTNVMEMLWVLWAVVAISAKRVPPIRPSGIPRIIPLRV